MRFWPSRYLVFLEKFSSSRLFLTLFYGLLFLFIFSFNYFLPTDPDLGWHLRYGEETLKNRKISLTDTFSYTFYDKSVVDAEWLVESFLYLIFSRFSFLGLAVVFGFLTSLAFFLPAISCSGSNFGKFLIITWALLGASNVLDIGARPQNVSWVLFSLVLILLFQYGDKRKVKYLFPLPLIFLFWANMHPGFYLGLFLIFIFLAADLFNRFLEILRKAKQLRIKEEIKIHLPLFLIFLLSWFFTYLRPQPRQGESLLPLDFIKALLLPVDVAAQASPRGVVRREISEWLPPTFLELSGSLFFLGIILSVAIFSLRPISKKEIKNLILLLVFIYFSTLSVRNVPFFFLVFIPIMIMFSKEFIKGKKLRLFLPYFTFLAVLIMLVASVFKISKTTQVISQVGSSIDSYCQVVGYPCEAFDFIKKEKLQGNMFNDYNWGGFLIWQLPDYPVSIDGRMPGEKIFSEYQAVTGLKEGWDKVLEKYGVGFIIYRRTPIFEEIVKEEGWEEIYSDESAVILKRAK